MAEAHPLRPDAPDEDWFSAEPSGERTAKIHVCYRRYFIQQFLSSIDATAEGIKLDVSHIRDRIAGLDPEMRLSPAAYVCLADLGEAMSSGNITRVLDALWSIQRTTDAELRDGDLRVEPAFSEEWERLFLSNVRGSEIDGEGARLLRPLIDPDPSGHFVGVHEALKVIGVVDPQMRAEFDELVCRVELFTGKGYYGFSSPAAFGAIFIRLPDAEPCEYFLEHLVRDLSHLALNMLMIHDPLLENPGDMHKTRLSDDERPLFLILQATYVLSRLVRVFRRAGEREPGRYDETLDHLEKKYGEGFRTVEREARLTDPGRLLFRSFEPV